MDLRRRVERQFQDVEGVARHPASLPVAGRAGRPGMPATASGPRLTGRPAWRPLPSCTTPTLHRATSALAWSWSSAPSPSRRRLPLRPALPRARSGCPSAARSRPPRPSSAWPSRRSRCRPATTAWPAGSCPPRRWPGPDGAPGRTARRPAPASTAREPRPGIVIVHGWESNRGRSLAHVRYLHAAGFHCLAIDVRGHGDNPPEELPISVPEFAADAAAAAALAGGPAGRLGRGPPRPLDGRRRGDRRRRPRARRRARWSPSPRRRTWSG